MTVDSTSAFFLEATCMNHKQLLPQQLLQVKGPQKSRDPLVFGDRVCLAVVDCITSAWWSEKKKLLPLAALSYGRSTKCLSIIKYLQCKLTFKLMFVLHEVFKVHRTQTCGDWERWSWWVQKGIFMLCKCYFQAPASPCGHTGKLIHQAGTD